MFLCHLAEMYVKYSAFNNPTVEFSQRHHKIVDWSASFIAKIIKERDGAGQIE